MTKHPYLRAYLAGIAVPTVFLLVAMTVYAMVRYVYDLPVPIERVIVFPMAGVPNAWGLWNMIYVAFLSRRHFSLGLFGGALPLLIMPAGYLVARLLEFPIPHGVFFAVPFGFPIALIVYYLVWKYFVGFLNAELGIA
jgi:hypothetical protein